jgi:1-acyl-sn-glycerol-3-phosphate acyltransferase
MNPVSAALFGFTKALVGAHPRWQGCAPSTEQSVYFANHTSHIDTLAIWAALNAEARGKTRPVAAKDYWNKGLIRRYFALRGLRAVLIERHREERAGDPLEPLIAALQEGDSLILFPEGTRGTGPLPAPFRSGLYRLAQLFPAVRLMPVYLENLHRAMPKGTLVPIPLICTVRFGAPLERLAAESKEAFLERARAAVVTLA